MNARPNRVVVVFYDSVRPEWHVVPMSRIGSWKKVFTKCSVAYEYARWADKGFF